MKKIEQFQITGMTISGFKSYQEPTELVFGNPTVITGGNFQGKTSIADAIAFAVTGLPFFGERGIDKLHNELNPDVFIALRFIDKTGAPHELIRTRKKNRMTINYDGYEVRQLDLTDLFGERDVFLSILNPLYFIEELGEDGKNLLEMHLPMIPHETVMAQLSEGVRANLEPLDFPSPETWLKQRREEIRGLEEKIIYLNGQKDLSQTQAEARTQTVREAETQLAALREELTGLENRRFAGLDCSAMEEELVTLSSRYEELARDEHGSELDAKIRELEQRLAVRRAARYQSQYTQKMAELTATVTELGNRYKREIQVAKALVPGVSCPTCHRPVTEETLPEVQAEMRKVIAAIVAAGKEGRSQLAQMQELDRKSAETFAQFQSDDVSKLEAELFALRGQRAERSDVGQVAQLQEQIRQLTAALEYGNLSQAEYDRLRTCKEDIRQWGARLAAASDVDVPTDFDGQISQAEQQIKEMKKQMTDVVIYISKRAELTFSQLKMNRVEFSLYDVVKSTGECKPAFKFTYNGRRYDRLSLSEKVRAGMEVSELMKRLTGRNYPVFVDNMESIDDLANVKPTGQVIMAKCVKGTALTVRPVKPIPTAEPMAA